MGTQPEARLNELLKEFTSAMLVTKTENGQLRSRPMALADVEQGGTIWLLTQRHSGKVREVAGDDAVNVSFQAKMKFVSISGTATPVEDRRKVAELWNEAWKVWFPGGQDDPSLILLRIDGKQGEYWDNSGTSGIKYLIEAGKAYLSGTHPDVEGDPKIHAKVDLSRA